MKRKLISILAPAIALSLILFFITGCKKNTSEDAIAAKLNKPIIEIAKSWFNSDIVSKEKQRIANQVILLVKKNKELRTIRLHKKV